MVQLMSVFFFFRCTLSTQIYTLSLHDALPILNAPGMFAAPLGPPVTWATPRTFPCAQARWAAAAVPLTRSRSEEHTSELQSRLHLVCRLLLEKKKLWLQYSHRSSLHAGRFFTF